MKNLAPLLTTSFIVLLVLGVIRYSVLAFNPEYPLLPDANYFFKMFKTFPNFMDEASAIVDKFSTLTVRGHWEELGIWGLPWDIFDMITGNVHYAEPTIIDAVQLLFLLLSYPIRIIIWLFTALFGYNPYVVAA